MWRGTSFFWHNYLKDRFSLQFIKCILDYTVLYSTAVYRLHCTISWKPFSHWKKWENYERTDLFQDFLCENCFQLVLVLIQKYNLYILTIGIHCCCPSVKGCKQFSNCSFSDRVNLKPVNIADIFDLLKWQLKWWYWY